MGKFEREDSKKILAGKPILRGTRRSTLWDFLSWPYRAYQQRQREAEIRKNIFKTSHFD